MGQELTSRRALRTRELALDAAIALFVERGYDATSYDDIAGRAELARATVFNHFPRKDLFLEAWADKRRDRMRELTDEDVAAGSTVERFAWIAGFWAASYLEDVGVNRPLVLCWASSAALGTPEAFGTGRVFAGIVREGQERGDVDPALDADVAGRALWSAGLLEIIAWAGDGSPSGSLTDRLATAVGIVARGLAPR